MAWNPRQVWVAVVILGLSVACLGCQPSKKEEKQRTKESPSSSATRETAPLKEESSESVEKTEPKATPSSSSETPSMEKEKETEAAETVVPSIPPAKKTKKSPPKEISPSAAIPKVFLSEELRASCLVNVGDSIPEGEVLDKNQPVALKSLLGDSLTVVVFWTNGSRSSLVEMFEDMQKDVFEPFEAKGVQVLAVKVGDKPESTKEIVEQSGAKYPQLDDPTGKYFKTIASGALPRIFLLDHSGKILWFDIDYARATRRDLQTALHAVLDEKK